MESAGSVAHPAEQLRPADRSLSGLLRPQHIASEPPREQTHLDRELIGKPEVCQRLYRVFIALTDRSGSLIFGVENGLLKYSSALTSCTSWPTEGTGMSNNTRRSFLKWTRAGIAGMGWLRSTAKVRLERRAVDDRNDHGPLRIAAAQHDRHLAAERAPASADAAIAFTFSPVRRVRPRPLHGWN